MPITNPSREDVEWMRRRYPSPRMTAVPAAATAIMDSKRGRAESRNGNASDATTKVTSQARIPNPTTLSHRVIGVPSLP
jgi:hypothetical protein